ncbi:MAG: protein-export chaperone SecB [Magnetococcales bacterium]|nr:protein-export chaperone SecB [Magnetococcales bacterium]
MSEELVSATGGAAAAVADGPPVFHVEKLYLKDLSFESPNAPGVFRESLEPKVDLNLATGTAQKGPEHFEVTLHLTVKVFTDEHTLFLVELTYAGLFLLHNVPQELVTATLGIECPAILFPYVRHIVSEMVMQGGFRPLMLDPINFSALFHQSQNRDQSV